MGSLTNLAGIWQYFGRADPTEYAYNFKHGIRFNEFFPSSQNNDPAFKITFPSKMVGHNFISMCIRYSSFICHIMKIFSPPDIYNLLTIGA